VIFLVKTDVGQASVPVNGSYREQLLAALPFPPLEVHNLGEEVGKVASDMYISLALANMRIYLFGGIVLAVVAIFSVAAANYAEDRRTLALLRIRGVSPRQLWRFMLALLLSPALLGLLIGTVVAVLAGYGLANHVWELREIKTVVQLLRTRLVFSTSFVSVALSLIALLIAAVTALSWWVYQRTAHQKLRGV
jgi:ABC-type lipoprotein release transport system permease subunit